MVQQIDNLPEDSNKLPYSKPMIEILTLDNINGGIEYLHEGEGIGVSVAGGLFS